MVANFNSSDVSAFRNAWVFCEQGQGVMMPTTAAATCRSAMGTSSYVESFPSR